MKLKNKGKIHLQIILFKITADCVYVGEGGAGVAARELNIDEHQVIKTLVMENERGDPVFHFPCVNNIPRSRAFIFASNKSGLVNFSS